jgi:hypothetical protein
MFTEKVTDNFNIANQNPLSNNFMWGKSTIAGYQPFKVVSNAVTPATPAGQSISFFSGYNFGQNQFSKVLLNVQVPPGGPSVRCSDTSFYFLDASRSGVKFARIYKFINPTLTALGIAFGNLLLGISAYLELRIEGSLLSVYDGGNLIYSVVDSSITSGYPGIYGDVGTVILDNFSAGDDVPLPVSSLVLTSGPTEINTVNHSVYYDNGTPMFLYFPKSTIQLHIETHDQNAQGMFMRKEIEYAVYKVLSPTAIQVTFTAKYRTQISTWGLGVRFNYNGVDYSNPVDFVVPNGKLYYRVGVFTIILHLPVSTLGVPMGLSNIHLGSKSKMRLR